MKASESSEDPWRDDALGWLLHPLSADTFFRQTWEQQLHLVQRGDPAYYGRFFTRDDAEMVVTTTPVPSRSELVLAKQHAKRHSIPAGRDGLGDLSALLRAYADGFTFAVSHLEERSPAVTRLCRALEARLQFRVLANLYLTPADAQSSGLHWDNHDVLVLQLEGAKRWRIWRPLYPMPLRDTPVRIARESLAEPEEVLVQPGDLLYLPRGYPHEPYTAGTASLHITLSWFPEHWHSLLQTALRLIAERDMRFREALPVGHLGGPAVRASMGERFRALVSLFAEQADFEAAEARLNAQTLSLLPPPIAGHLSSIEQLGALTLDSIVERAPQVLCSIAVEEEVATIHFPGGFVTGPAAIEPALRFIEEAQHPFSIRSLPAPLADRHRLELATRLIKEGLLVVRSTVATSANV